MVTWCGVSAGQFTKQWEMTSLLCAHCLPANRDFQNRKFKGAFHLLEIPEILLENQMERVKDSGGFRSRILQIQLFFYSGF